MEWSGIKDVTERIVVYRARQPDTRVQREQEDLVREIKKVLDQASTKIRRWLVGRKGAMK
jgi:hypothetical protein